MKFTSKEIKNILILTCVFILSFAFIEINNNNIIYHILAMVLFCFTAAKMVTFDILHPLTWFSSFFCLYSVSYPLLCQIGIYSKYFYNKEIIFYQLLAIFIVTIIIGTNKNKKLNIDNLQKDFSTLGIINKILYSFIIIAVFLGTLFVSNGGYTGKDDVYANGGFFINIIFRLPLVLTIIYTIFVILYFHKINKLPWKNIIIVGVSLLSLTLFSGERDFLFRFIMINLFIFWYIRKINLKKIIVLLPALASIIPISAAFKYYFTRGVVYNQDLSIINSFLAGEFESSAKNLQLLINNKDITEGILGYQQILLDFISVFDTSMISPSNWFNRTFYPWSKSQYGFSLVGEGYVIGGTLGIVLLFVIIGLLIKMFYIRAHKNIYWISGYFYFITVVIYSFRGDLGTILSALIKQIIFVSIGLQILQRICGDRKIKIK